MGMVMRETLVKGRGRSQGSVREVLEWAFGAERASVEFDEIGAAPCGIDTVWLLMQRGRLGCKVDGGRYGGGAQSADDAEIVASVVSSLPVSHGGRGMALRIAELARAGLAPECYADVVSRVVALDWRRTKHGIFAVTVPARDLGCVASEMFAVRDSRVCPVRIVPTAQQIGAARRFYLDWLGALLHIGSELRRIGLSGWEVTQELPPMAPWRAREKSS